MQCLSNLENSGIIQDPTGSRSILDKIVCNFFVILVKRVWDLREDFERLTIKSEEDPAGQQIRSYAILQYPTGLLWNRNQFRKISYSTGSYSILEIPIRSYRIIWDGYGILDKHGRTPKHSKVLKSGIIQLPTGSHGSQTESYKIVINFSQDTMGSYTRL